MLTPHHFIGIGGIGMSALARILLEKGVPVSGSDLSETPIVKELRDLGAQISIGHTKEYLTSESKVIFTSGLSHDNPEYHQAMIGNNPLLHRSELLKELMHNRKALLVAGTHGKTTTSSLLAHVLHFCQQDPSFAIGGVLKNLNQNGKYGKGDYFVAEADESDGSFLTYPGYGGIITNIDNDHLDYWKDEENLNSGFAQFASHLSHPSHLFWCHEDERLRSLRLKGESYGFHPNATLCIKSFSQEGWMTQFTFQFQGKEYREVFMPLIGRHNVLNGSAVFGLALSLGIDEDSIRRAFLSFEGIGRRVEKRGEKGGVTFYDDYGHHPTEVMTTLKALKTAVRDRRMVVAFQPHRYTRTRDCIDQFPGAFEEADVLFLTDIYAAREKPIAGIADLFLAKIREKCSKEVIYVARGQLGEQLSQFLKPDDVLVTVGAGDITSVSQEVMEHLQ